MNKRIIYAHSTRQQIMSWYVADIVADNQITHHKKRKKGIFRLCFSAFFYLEINGNGNNAHVLYSFFRDIVIYCPNKGPQVVATICYQSINRIYLD